MNETAPTDPVSLVVRALETFLEDKSREERLTVRIIQFSSNLLYLPVYSFFQDAKNRMGDRLQLSYEEMGTDEAACEAVKSAISWPSNPNVVVLGVSELGDKYRKQRTFLEQPFIKRLPLWGIALANNPKIHQIKAGNHIATGEAGQRDWQTRLRFWKAFGGKLSLLRREDLVNSRVRLSSSLYTADTTARRLFDGFLGENGQMDFVSEVDTRNEFDDLFCGQVDIALTVQPWEAVREAGRRGREIEVVYVHQGAPEPFSSVYMYAKDEIVRAVLESLQKAIGLGVQKTIQNIYGMHWTNNLAPYTHAFRSALGASDNIEDENFECALDMICDSRVYYYDMAAAKEQLTVRSNGIQREFERNIGLWWVSNWTEGGDFLFKLSEIIAGEQILCGHDGIALDDQNCGSLRALKRISNAFERPITTSTTGADFKYDWRCRAFAEMFFDAPNEIKLVPLFGAGVVMPLLEEEYKDNDLNYYIWMPRAKIRDALNQFMQDFVPHPISGEPARFTLLKSSVGIVDSEVASIKYRWLLLEYANGNDEALQWDSFKHSKFCKVKTNPMAHKLLGAWWISGANQEVQQVFTKDHGMVAKTSITGSKLKFRDQEIGEIPAGHYGLLFTFKVKGQPIEGTRA